MRQWNEKKFLFQIILFGLGLGVLRGIAEALIVTWKYPFYNGLSHLLHLAILCCAGYGIVIGIGGTALAMLLYPLRTVNKNPGIFLPLAYLIVLFSIDVTGWNTPIIADFVRSVPERGAPVDDPDILLITLDTCRADHLAMYGYAAANIPTLARLAASGTVFETAFTSIPVTTPAHVSLMTGVAPPHHRSRFNAVPLQHSFFTLAEMLSDRGYLTGAFVSAYPVVSEISGLQRGFSIYDQLLTPRTLEPLFYRTTLMKPFTRLGPFRPAERASWRTEDSVRAWWKLHSNQTRFTWIHFYDAHAPYKPPETFRRIFSDTLSPPEMSIQRILSFTQSAPDQETISEFIAGYDGEIAVMDRVISNLIRDISNRGRLDHTLIIITADHGESLGEHNYYFSHGDHLFDPSLHIPLIMIWKNHIPGNKIISGQASILDILPTITSLLKIPAGTPRFDGIDLSRFFPDARPIPPRNLFSESGSGVYTHAHIAPDDRIQRKERAVRTETKKLILKPDGEMSLFDLRSDPGETQAVPMENNPDSQRLLRELSLYIQQVDPPNRRPPHLPSPEAIDQLRSLGYIDSP